MLARIRNRLALLDRSQAAPLKLSRAVASFTFDDFPTSAYTIGGKLIEAAGAHATYFASVAFMGKTVDGIEYFTSDLLKEIDRHGHEIGCHAFEHTRLPNRGAAFTTDTIKRNASSLRTILGDTFALTSFAYPFGDVSLPVKWAASNLFPLCRGVRRGLNTGAVDLAQIYIVSLESRHWNEAELAEIIATAVQTRSWIVFLTHDVSENPTPYGSTPEMIEAALRLVNNASIPILTLKAAAAKAILGDA